MKDLMLSSMEDLMLPWSSVRVDVEVEVFTVNNHYTPKPTENARKSFWGPVGSPRDKLFFAILQQTLSNLRHRIQVAASDTNQKDFLAF